MQVHLLFCSVLSLLAVMLELFSFYWECGNKGNSQTFQKEEQHNVSERRLNCFSSSLHWRRQGGPRVNWKIPDLMFKKKKQPSVLPQPYDRVSFMSQLFGRILKALTWDLPPFVLSCLWVYFLSTIEFFSFLKTAKTVDPSADTECCLSHPLLSQICEDYFVIV